MPPSSELFLLFFQPFGYDGVLGVDSIGLEIRPKISPSVKLKRIPASRAVLPASKRVKKCPENHQKNRTNDVYAIELPP